MQQNRFKMLLCLSANILRACCIDLAEVNRYTSVKQESCVCSPVWCRVDKIPVAFCLMIKSNVLRFHHSCFYPFPSEGEAALGVFGGVCVCVTADSRAGDPLGGGVDPPRCALRSASRSRSQGAGPEAVCVFRLRGRGNCWGGCFPLSKWSGSALLLKPPVSMRGGGNAAAEETIYFNTQSQM